MNARSAPGNRGHVANRDSTRLGAQWLETETDDESAAGDQTGRLRRWMFTPNTVLRMAGMPFEWLTELTDGTAAEWARGEHDDSPAATHGHDVPPAFADLYHREILAATDRVTDRFAPGSPLRNALRLNSPDSYGVIVDWLATQIGHDRRRNSHDRRKTDYLTLLLARACAKNDTAGVVGPFALGRFDERVATIDWHDVPVCLFPALSRWSAEALVTAAAADVRLATQARLNPLAVLNDGAVQVFDFDLTRRSRRFEEVLTVLDRGRVHAADAQVIEAIRDNSTAALGEVGQPSAESIVRLVEQGVIVPDPDLPVGVPDSLVAAEAAVSAGGESIWRFRLDEMRALVEALAVDGDTTALDDLGALFTTLTGEAATRKPGVFYGDRSVAYVESVGRCGGLRLPTAILDDNADDLDRAIDTHLLVPRRRLRLEREELATWFSGRFRSGRTTVADYLRAFAADAHRLESAYRVVDEELDRLNRRLRDAALPQESVDGNRHAIDIALLDDVLADVEPSALCNPDLMLIPGSAEGDQARLILSDFHAMEEVVSHQGFAPFMEDVFPTYATDVVNAYRSLLADDEEVVDVVHFHRNKAFIQCALPCRDIEVFGRSPKPRTMVVSLLELDVVADVGALRLVDPSRQTVLRPMANPLGVLALDRNPLAIFGFPYRSGGPVIELGDRQHTPRLEIGQVVVQRETWRVATSELTAPSYSAAFLRVQDRRADLGLPRHVYCHVTNEPKPFYCDLDSPLLVRQLCRLAKRSEAVVITEMWPEPDDLWLTTGDGSYTAELRCSAFSTSAGRRSAPGAIGAR